MRESEMRLVRRAVRRGGVIPPAPPPAPAPPTGWISGFNVPGYLPDTADPPEPTEWLYAWDFLLDVIEEARRQEDDPVADSALLVAYAAAVGSAPGESFDFTSVTGDGIRIAWWIMPVSP